MSHPPTRRDALYAGWLGGLGLTLGDVLALEGRAGGPREARAKSVINVYLDGGLAHQDSFDPKPDSPPEYRGGLGTVATNLPGVRFGELLPKVAAVADKMTVIRSMTHTEVDHGRGQHNMFTGYRPSPALVYPSLGSVVSHELGPRGELPPYVCVPNLPTRFAGSGYLSDAHGPFTLGSDPARGGFRVRDLARPAGVDERRFGRRKQIRSLVDAHFSAMETSGKLDAMDEFYGRAYAMLSSKKARAAFDLGAEPRSVRAEYGRYAGPRLLMARRLVEAGVRFVSVAVGSWDTHTYHERTLKQQMPYLDRALAALLNDLSRRGMLGETLVTVTTEFGRTPKVNGSAGRDHWPRVFSVALAGGGVKAGYVHGASDATASEPAAGAVSVEDYAATVYRLLGVDHERDLTAPGGRPLAIVRNGNVVRDLLA